MTGRWVRVALVVWALGYGGLRTYWALGHRPQLPPVGDDLMAFSDWGVVALCTMALGLGVASFARSTSRGLGWVRVVVGAVIAVGLTVAPVLLLLDVVGLLFPGMLPVHPGAFASRAACLVGAVLVAVVTRAHLREVRGACMRCGRTRWVPGVPRVAAKAPWWAVVAAYAAVTGCVTRFTAQYVVGMRSVPDEFATGGASVVAFLVCIALAGTLLPVALVHGFGQVLPRWVPVLGGRRVPRLLPLVPALVVSGALTTYFGTGVVQMVAEGGLGMPGLPAWFGWVAEPAYLVWGIGLGIAALSYGRRTRPACRGCVLLADRAREHAGDEAPLQRDVRDHDGRGDDHRGRREEGEVGGVLALEERQAERRGAEVLVARHHHQGEEELVPRPHEDEHDHRGQGRAAHRQQYAPQGRPARRTVEPRGLDERAR